MGEDDESLVVALDAGIGEVVYHQKFGRGVILSVDGEKLEIEFDNHGIKRVISSYITKTEN